MTQRETQHSEIRQSIKYKTLFYFDPDSDNFLFHKVTIVESDYFMHKKTQVTQKKVFSISIELFLASIWKLVHNVPT